MSRFIDTMTALFNPKKFEAELEEGYKRLLKEQEEVEERMRQLYEREQAHITKMHVKLQDFDEALRDFKRRHPDL